MHTTKRFALQATGDTKGMHIIEIHTRCTPQEMHSVFIERCTLTVRWIA